MNPWLVFWAPQFTFPFGGSVAQRIEPDTNWFFAGIDPAAGDATIERKAFEVATYGRQLGLITELLVDLAAQTPPKTAAGKWALDRLHDIQARIEQVKETDAAELQRQAEALIARLAQQHPARLPQLQRRIAQALDADSAG